MSIPGLVHGRVVTYYPAETETLKEPRSATVVKANKETGVVSLLVNLNGRADGIIVDGAYQNHLWVGDVPFSEENTPRSWNWTPKE